MNLHAGASAAKVRSIGAAAVKSMLEDGGELALIDVREELTFSQNHLLWARNAAALPAGVALRAAGAAQRHAHRACR